MKNILFIIIVGLLCTKASAEIIVNELLINEPEAYRNLEWIELYNSSNFAEDLNEYELFIDGDIVFLSPQIVMQPGEYIIICRKLFSENNQVAYEMWYGNNNGIWGDTSSERFCRQPLEADFSLINTHGNISLLKNNNTVSNFNWTNGGEDGISFERLNQYDSLFLPSIDVSGVTPGFINSITSVDFDLAIDSSWVINENDQFYLLANVSNKGLLPVEYSSLFVGTSTDTSAFASIPLLNSGEIYTVEFCLELPGYYADVVLNLSIDDRHTNNQYFMTVPGVSYPPVILSEILANPSGTLNSEWIELINISDSLISLDNWQIIDAVGNVMSLSGIIESNEYLVLVEDKFDFENYYNNLSSIIEPDSWTTLNNSSETIILVDNFGIISDNFEYENSFAENHSWSRDENNLAEKIWGQSVNSGGTPGCENELYPVQSNNTNIVTITPTHFSPPNNEFVSIVIQAVNVENYTARIYDKLGRVVKTFFEKQAFIPSEFNWDGLTDSGHKIPVGVYLFYFEAEGTKPIKKPIVITR
ncbi:MAG: lamin tail domain-containing protein [candidate division Zixibacteria bacterium]|nr:lamin tail domain-containing protein [candidate division Zixibacteria bacterium]